MSRGAAAALDIRRPTTQPACPFCDRGPLLPTEATCPFCRSKGLKVFTRCRVCDCALTKHDDYERGVCESCADRPEGKRLLVADGRKAPTPPPGAPGYRGPAQIKPEPPPAPPQKRLFSAAEKSLIKHMHHILPAADLLRILNDRLVADLGQGTPLWTLEQLHAETSTLQQSQQAADWAGLREILRVARSCGVLEQITPQVIDDFAVVFGLSSAQVMNVRDVIRSAKEGA